VTITGIALDAGQHYVVNYQALGLPEVMTSTHVHFFFDTVPFEKAGAPAEKTWHVWFGPSPFPDLTVADRPPDAGQICVQAANPNHTPLPGTGSCAPALDVVPGPPRGLTASSALEQTIHQSVSRGGGLPAHLSYGPVTTMPVVAVATSR
jgi:hypothetical protein